MAWNQAQRPSLSFSILPGQNGRALAEVVFWPCSGQSPFAKSMTDKRCYLLDKAVKAPLMVPVERLGTKQ